MNGVGYRLLGAGKKAEAITVFEQVTQRYPGSANAWDSLSEAQEAAGRTADALAATAKGLDALATDKALAAPRRDLIEKSLRERKARLEKGGK